MENKIDIQPTLIGDRITLRPLKKEDFSALYRAASDPVIWELHPDSSRYKRKVFEERFFIGAIKSQGALAIFDNSSNRLIGSTRFYKWKPDTKEITIGYTFLTPDQWGNGSNSEVKELMLKHIFQFSEVVWFGVGETNIRSRKAVEKLGAILSHKEKRELDGKPYVQLFYKISSSSLDATN